MRFPGYFCGAAISDVGVGQISNRFQHVYNYNYLNVVFSLIKKQNAFWSKNHHANPSNRHEFCSNNSLPNGKTFKVWNLTAAVCGEDSISLVSRHNLKTESDPPWFSTWCKNFHFKIHSDLQNRYRPRGAMKGDSFPIVFKTSIFIVFRGPARPFKKIIGFTSFRLFICF